ncbi:MAG: glycosyltransferase family 2 protein [Planctomycetota bacterium]
MPSLVVIVEVLAAAICLLWILGSLVGLRVLRNVPLLDRAAQRLPPTPAAGSLVSAAPAPLLTVVIPAANEAGSEHDAADLVAAHRSRLVAAGALAARASAAVELIYVDDRSNDHTGAIFDEFVAEAALATAREPLSAAEVAGPPRVVVRALHLRELPEGWLGKTHALQKGFDAAGALGVNRTDAGSAAAERAAGTTATPPPWILFTDADVRLTPDALTRALAHAEARGLDHLTLMPQLDQGGLLRDATLAAFGRVFSLGCRLWAVNDPRSSASLGVGAFNLVRGEALRRVGGLRRVRLAVADDMALGELLRREGARQGVASGRDAVRLAWYRSVPEMVRGIEKGIFGYGARCEPWRAFVGAALLLALELAPWLMLLHGHLAWLGAVALAAGLLTVALGERWMGRRLLPVLLMPLGGLVMIWAILRAGYLGGRRGGVLWRGTFYPSSLLREALSWEGGTRGGRPRQS